MQVVDVRDMVDFTPAHIPHAKSIPIRYDASGQVEMNESIKNQLLALPKDVPLIFYGYGIIENDRDAFLMAQALADFNDGFTDIRVLIKGHDRWVELGYTTVETGG
jgi:rhodanese-related sulfurtransferase